MKLRGAHLLLLTTLFTGSIAILVMVGWVIHSLVLVQISPTFSPMQFNTAIAILIWSFVLQAIDKHSRKFCLFLTIIVVLFLLLTLFEYLFNVNLGIDTFLVYPFTQINTSNVGRMAPNTALALLFIGIALFFLHKGFTKEVGKYQTLMIILFAVIACSLGIIPLIGYSNNLETAYAWGNFTRMAFHTALCIVLLSISIIIKIWNKENNRLFFAPIAVVFGGIVITVSLSLAIYSQENIFFENILQVKANNVASIATAQLQDLYKALERMGDRFRQSKEVSKTIFQKDAENYINDFPYISMISWVDTTTKAHWLIVSNVHEKPLFDGSESESFIASKIQKIRSVFSSKKTGMVSILSEDNDKKFFYIKPIVLNQQSDEFLMAQIDVPQFINHLFPFLSMDDSFFVSIYAEKKRLFSNIDPVEIQKNRELLDWQKNAAILNNDSKWTVIVNPSLAMLTKKNTSTPWVVLWIGLFVTVLTAIAVFFRLKLQNTAIELLAAQHLNKSILNSATYLMIATDKKGVVILFNHRAETALGYSESEAVRKLTPAAWHDLNEINNRAKELSEELGRFVAPGFDVFITKAVLQGSESHEWTFINKDGSTFPGLLTVTPLQSDTGKGIGFLGVIEDLSERKHIEQQLAKYTKELERNNQEILLLNELSNNLQACGTIEETYEPIKQYCQQALKVTRGILYIVGKDGSQLTAVIDWGYVLHHETFYLNIDDCWGLRKKKIHHVIKSNSGLSCKHLPDIINRDPAYLCIPIQSNFRLLGLLHIELPSEQDDFLTCIQSGLIDLMAEQLALSFVSLQLRKNLHALSVRDPLTDLYNRRYLEESMKQEIADAARHNKSFVISLIDIDYFKKINDSFGHAAGDFVLKHLSELFSKSIRKSDIVCRWGGEEFLLYFNNSSLSTIQKKTENLRHTIESLTIHYQNHRINLTISVGIAQYPQHGLTLQSLLASADSALYEAKNAGRNRVVIATQNEETPDTQ